MAPFLKYVHLYYHRLRYFTKHNTKGLCPLRPLPFRPLPFCLLEFGPLPIRQLITWSSCQIVLYHLVLSHFVHLPCGPLVDPSCICWSFIILSYGGLAKSTRLTCIDLPDLCIRRPVLIIYMCVLPKITSLQWPRSFVIYTFDFLSVIYIYIYIYIYFEMII